MSMLIDRSEKLNSKKLIENLFLDICETLYVYKKNCINIHIVRDGVKIDRFNFIFNALEDDCFDDICNKCDLIVFLLKGLEVNELEYMYNYTIKAKSVKV